MIYIEKFVSSPFQENTFVVYNEQKDCWIIDPGCYEAQEKQTLKTFISNKGLRPVKLINTHCHLDHVFGNNFVCAEYGLLPEYHEADAQTMKMAPISASMYGIPGFEESPAPANFLDENSTLKLGEDEFEIRFCPGHAPGHIVFIQHKHKLVINGDVLFQGSIGRTDLPGGNHDQLLKSIKEQLYSLPDDYTVYTGHGPETSIGKEKITNPFVRG